MTTDDLINWLERRRLDMPNPNVPLTDEAGKPIKSFHLSDRGAFDYIADSGDKGDNDGDTTVQIVTIKDGAFGPNPKTVYIPDTVRWVNEDNVSHQIEIQSADGVVTLPEIKHGQHCEYEFKVSGRYPYICLRHKAVVAGLIVASGGE